MAKLIQQEDTTEVKKRLALTLSRLYPGKTDFTMEQVMEALEIMGEFRG